MREKYQHRGAPAGFFTAFRMTEKGRLFVLCVILSEAKNPVSLTKLSGAPTGFFTSLCFVQNDIRLSEISLRVLVSEIITWIRRITSL
jgi:hypothetical protein